MNTVRKYIRTGLCVCVSVLSIGAIKHSHAEYSQQVLFSNQKNQVQSLSSADLGLELPLQSLKSYPKLASVQFITGGKNLTFEIPEFPDISPDPM